MPYLAMLKKVRKKCPGSVPLSGSAQTGNGGLFWSEPILYPSSAEIREAVLVLQINQPSNQPRPA